jgi:hypothetical protein
MESRKDHVVKRKPRTVDQKRKRRDRERGPWKCPLCEVCEFSSINGLRGHCALTHRHYCSWTGKIRPFQTFEEEQKFVDGIRKGRQHRRGASSSTVTVVVAAGTSESSHPQPTPSDPATSALVDVEPSTSSGRVMRMELGQPPPTDDDDFTELLSAFNDLDDVAVADDWAVVSSWSPFSTSAVQLAESTPMPTTTRPWLPTPLDVVTAVPSSSPLCESTIDSGFGGGVSGYCRDGVGRHHDRTIMAVVPYCRSADSIGPSLGPAGRIFRAAPRANGVGGTDAHATRAGSRRLERSSTNRCLATSSLTRNWSCKRVVRPSARCWTRSCGSRYSVGRTTRRGMTNTVADSKIG